MSTVTQTASFHYTRAGVQSGFLPLEDRKDRHIPRLSAPVPAHLGFASIAVVYAQCEKGGVLQQALCKLRRFNNPRVQELDTVVFRQGADGITVGSSYDARADGCRFQWCKHPNSVGAQGDTDRERRDVVEQHGMCLSYDRLYDYATKGLVDPETFDVSDSAGDLPRVFLKLRHVSTTDKCLVAFLEDLMIGHARGVLTVRAARVPKSGWSDVSSKLQNSVSTALGSRGKKHKLLSLFTLESRGGVRGAYEMCLRRNVLLRVTMCDAFSSKAKKRAALEDLGRHECKALWDAHACQNTACVHRVWKLSQKKRKAEDVTRSAEREKSQDDETAASYVPAELPWDRIRFDCREAALDAMAQCLNWKSILRPLPPQHKWSNISSDRLGARKCEWRDLNIPQVRQCTRDAAWQEEVARDDRDEYRILVTDTAPTDCDAFDGVLYLGTGGVDSSDGSLVHWGDKTVTVKTKDGDRTRKRRETWVVVDVVPESSRVVCLSLTSKDAEMASLLMRLFPFLLQAHDDPQPEVERQVHPHVQKTLREMRDKCESWESEYTDVLDEDKKKKYDERMEYEDRKQAERLLQYFQRAKQEYNALLTFTYPGCDLCNIPTQNTC